MTPPRFGCRGSRGIALIFLLAMVVLLTVLVVLILNRATLNRQISSSSSGQQKADQLAQAGLQNVLNDLRQEIAAGSSTRHSSFIATYNSINVPFPSTSYQSATYASTNVYIPTSNQTSVPAFAGYAPTTPANDYFPNWLKRSAYNVPFFGAANASDYNTTYPPLASSLSTGTSTSLDGRSISSARWNKPMLMDPTKLSGTFTPPDWIIVTRSGPKAFAGWNASLKDTTDQANYAVGRYAYMIYDEGGLLDANTAGCNSVNSAGTAGLTTDFDKSSKRGRLGQADLTALPGLTQADVDKLVQWRNATTANAASNPVQSYFDYLFHGNFSAGSFQYNVATTTAPVVDPSSAFMTAINGDQTFLSRQDLLNFFDFTFGANATQDKALPYLGTFSRELNAPSYCPPDPNPINSNTITGAPAPVVQKYYKYADNAESTTLPVSGNPNPNRNFPSVKFANTGTLTDGTVVTAGEPLVRRRFALSRLQLIAAKIANPSVATNDTLIHNYFGLTYDNTSGKWTYTSPDSSSVATTIKTLDQVAQLNPPREPDFFELLQAGILNGSLGKTACIDLNGNSSSGSETVNYDSHTDYQVIQIGANIIDQSGADPAPTTIMYGGSDTASSPDAYDFYGIGNLPYISKISQTMYRLEKPGVDPVSLLGNPYSSPPNQPWARPFVAAWLQFELWNPHQNPQAGPALPLRIYAQGSIAVVAFNSVDNPGDGADKVDGNGGIYWAPWPGNPNAGAPAMTYAAKTFASDETLTVPSSAYALPTADYFREPVTLTSDLGVTVDTVNHPEDHVTEKNYFTTTGWDFIGLKTAETFASEGYAMEDGYPTYGHTPRSGEPLEAQDFGLTTNYPNAPAGGITFYLQCQYNGKWRTIQRIKNCVVANDTPNSVVPSSWLKGRQGDYSQMVPCESEYLTQVNGNFDASNGYPRVAYRMLPDPRTDRFGAFESYREDPHNMSLGYGLFGPDFNQTMLPSTVGFFTKGLFGYQWSRGRMRMPNTASYQLGLSNDVGISYTYNGWFSQFDSNNPGSYYDPSGNWAALLSINSKNIPAQFWNGLTQFVFYNYYYADKDGIIRGGDSYYADGKDEDNNGYLDGYVASMPSAIGGAMASAGAQRPERPIMLNRPFRSPGELGYVHRGEPWKSLDFFTPDSADAGLLDLFTLDDEDVVAGTVDLNTRQAPVLQAILQGASKNELATTASDPSASTTQNQNNIDPVFSTGSSGDASALASALVQERLSTVSPNGPLANRSELVTRFLGQNTANPNFTQFPLSKTRREGVVRPLAAVGNTRTWNLLIDIIAQSGRYPSTANALGQFVIEGEKRYWWHVAIDRFTGQIVDSQLEPVYE